MYLKKLSSFIVGVFLTFLLMFLVLSHLLSFAVLGEGQFFTGVFDTIRSGILFVGTPELTIQYFSVLIVLLATAVILVIWFTKLFKAKKDWKGIFKPLFFLIAIITTLLLVKVRTDLEALYQQQNTRLMIVYLVFSALMVLITGLHFMVLGLAVPVEVERPHVCECEHEHHEGVADEEVRKIVAEEMAKQTPVMTKEEPVVEEKVEEVAEEKIEEKVEAKPVEKVEEKVIVASQVVVEKKEPPVAPTTEGDEGEFERIPFAERISHFDKEILEKYDELKQYMLAYGVKSRISSSGDSFRAKRVMYFKITNSGNSGFKVYFKLDINNYANTTYPLKDAHGIKMYEEVPAFMYLKSDLSLKRCKELVDDVMAAHGFVKK